MAEYFDLTGRIAWVTGSTRGIGKAIAIALAKCHAKVIINSRMSRDEAAGAFPEAFHLDTMYYVQGDVTDENSVKSMTADILKKFGRVDILVNNAGGADTASVLVMKGEQADQMYRVNTRPAFLMVQALSKQMLRKRYGRIINISSMAGVSGLAMQSHYAAAKSALVGFSKSVAKELGGKGITCNVVAPGALKNSRIYDQEQEQQVLNLIPCKRLGTAEDVAAAVLYLASEESGYVNGQVIRVDGGMGL